MTTKPATIRDRLWIWGMQVNALQQTGSFGKLGFDDSTLTVEQAIEQTGIKNVYMAGGLEINEESLAAMPSAGRIVCKWSLHTELDDKIVLNIEVAEARLLAAKQLAASDPRVEAFLLDDFSTGSMDAGASPEHMARLQYINTTTWPHLPLYETIYSMTLERDGLADMMRYADLLLVPLWHFPECDTMPARIERCAELTGNKPMLFCLYFYDFGNHRMLERNEMQQQLDIVEPLIREQRVTGLMMCGTCMMDLGWESVDCYQEWVRRVGDDELS